MVNKVYILVGVPGSGKSTWIKNQVWALGMPVVSTDAHVENHARKLGLTYSDVFNGYMPTAVDLMVNHAVHCRTNSLDFIWDQTSTSIATRAKKIRMLPDYYKIAVVFKTPEPEELARRLASRPGKNIPPEVSESMVRQLRDEPPTKEEGFDELS